MQLLWALLSFEVPQLYCTKLGGDPIRPEGGRSGTCVRQGAAVARVFLGAAFAVVLVAKPSRPAAVVQLSELQRTVRTVSVVEPVELCSAVQ